MKLLRCRGCGRLAFPPRLWCPDCGAPAWEEADAPEGVVETATESREGVSIGTVLLDDGPPVLARLEGAEAGARVRLDADGGVPVARPN